MIVNNTEGINPTAEFIANQYTGKFIKILKGTYIIKEAKNELGFDQGYALENGNRKELLLIDVVEEASKAAVESIIAEGYKVSGILITGQTVLEDAFDDLETLSANAGEAPVYLPKELISNVDYNAKILDNNDPLLRTYDLDIQNIPGNRRGMVLIYSSRNEGMLFAGDAAQGSDYKSDIFTFSRQKEERQNEEFETSKFWKTYPRDFNYFFPRKGKPAIEVDGRTRTTLLDKLSRGASL